MLLYAHSNLIKYDNNGGLSFNFIFKKIYMSYITNSKFYMLQNQCRFYNKTNLHNNALPQLKVQFLTIGPRFPRP